MSCGKTLPALLVLTLFSIALTTAALAADEAKGRNLLNALGCKGCHAFEGSGGTIGPAFDEIGKRLSAAEIEAKLLHPKKNNSDSLMPDYGYVPEADRKTLAKFLARQK